MLNPPRCLACNKLANSRGLCRRHYQLAARSVKAGSDTWDKMEAEGRSLPPQSKEQKTDRLFRQVNRRER